MKDNRINLEKSSTIWRSYRDSFQESELSIWLVKNRQWWLTKWIMASIRNVKQNLTKNIFKGQHYIQYIFQALVAKCKFVSGYKWSFEFVKTISKAFSSWTVFWQNCTARTEKEIEVLKKRLIWTLKIEKKERETKDVLNEIRKERESSER